MQSLNAKGCHIVPKPRLKFRPARADELQIDCDTIRFSDNKGLTAWVHERKERIEAIDNHYRQIIAEESKGGKIHFRIQLSFELSSMERIALQAALGDDPMRVVLNWKRARAGDRHPVLLLEKTKCK